MRLTRPSVYLRRTKAISVKGGKLVLVAEMVHAVVFPGWCQPHLLEPGHHTEGIIVGIWTTHHGYWRPHTQSHAPRKYRSGDAP
jgi:hypothetical protein